MSLKIFNTQTGQWEKQSTQLATNIKVTDLEAKYKSNNINGCLDEIADTITDIKADIKYIYENGTIGGGSGGSGGASTPLVTIDGDTEYLVNSDEMLDIYYYFTSPNPGNGTANLTYGGNVTQISIPQARNKWTVGPFPRGTYTLTISVEDKQGFWSIPAQVKVISGSLAITSSFSDAKDFTLSDNIVIPYQVLTEIPESVFLDYTFNGVKHTTTANIGSNELNIGILPFMGVSTLTMQLRNSKYTSNILKYTLVATDSVNLFMSTTFDKTIVEVGKNVQIDYRISMKNQYSFNTDYYIDGKLLTTVVSYPGVNFWNVGSNLEKGVHTLQIVTHTVDGNSANDKILSLTFEVVTVGYEPYRHVNVGLIAEYDASGKLNNSVNETIWEDTSGNNVACNLYNFNYFSNGWINQDADPKTGEIAGTRLVMSGKAYAEIDLAPFKDGIQTGFTLDVLFKIQCVGDVNAKVLTCKAPVTPFQGIEINTWNVSMTTKRSEVTSAQIQDNTWTKATYVVDRTSNTMIIYINGVISSVTYLLPNDLSQQNYEDEFTFDGKILLGAMRDGTGTIVNNSVCSIQNVRVYRRALTDDEVLQNYIADITDEDKQMAVRNLNTNTEGMPTMSFVGNFDMMDENSERIGQISYNDPKQPSKTFVKDGCLISWQGTSSKNYPVKNWTIKLKDGGQPCLTYTPQDYWKSEDRWTLKANYMDSSSANNPGTQKFIYDFFKPYPYPSQIKDPTTRPNSDGFPIKLVINGQDAGIYTWNVDRYALNNYGFVTYNSDGTVNRHPTAVSYEIQVNGTTGAAAFWDDSWDSIKTEFKSRYNYRGEEDAVTETLQINGVPTKVLKIGMHNELQALVTWVKNCSDEQFASELNQHFSKRHLIDYYLIAYIFGMVDNLGKNMVLSTWGKDGAGNTIWYPSFYDCDSLFGLNNSGIIAFDAGLDMDSGDYNTSRSNLWVKLVKMFGQEIRNRYCELRLPRTINNIAAPPIFSYENMISYIGGQVMDTIGQKFYNKDARIKYLNTVGQQWLYLCNGDRRQFTERWLKERFTYMDSVYQFNYDIKSVLRSYAQGQLTLNIRTYSPQWILISFSDKSDTKLKKYVNKDDWTEFSMYIDNGTDNNIEIYGCDNIMYIDGIKMLDVRSINIANAAKLVELDISGSSRIEEISLGNNTYLQKVLCNNCKNLGYTVDNKTLDLFNCTNLKSIDCSNTHIANVMFNPVGGVIENLNCSYTDITAFTLTGQTYLSGLTLDGCANLSELTITDCNGIKTITMANTKLSKAIINGCNALEYLDISNTKSLKTLDLSGCPNLKTLLMSGVSNPAITDLDLTYSLKLETLDISASNYIQTLTFGQYMENGVMKNYNALKSLKCDSSTIKSIRYGKAATVPAYLDLNGLNLTYLNFSSCTNVADIRNINLVAESGTAPFNNCYNLTSIQGIVKLKGDITRAFYNCKNLITLPTLDLSEVTYMSETFMYCNKLTMTHLTNIMVNSQLSSKFTSQWRAFCNCIGISGTLPSNLFSKCTGLTTLSEFFNGCTGINGTLSATILQPMTNLQSCYYAFAGTNISGEVPQDLLRYNTKLTSTERMFYNTKVTYAYLDNLLAYNSALTSAYGMFTGCTSLSLSPTANMFLYNKNLASVGSFFNGCPGVVGTIPRHIFNNAAGTNGNTKLTNIESFFSGTNISGTIPAYNSDSDKGLLDCSPLLDSIQYLFNGCSGLTGTIPSDFLKYNNNITRAAGVFNGCSGLGDAAAGNNIPTNIFKGKTKLTTINQFFKNCSGLYGQIPVGLLNDCTMITDISEMFYNCNKINGEIPKRISTWAPGPSPIDPNVTIQIETVQQYGLFDKCTNLVNASAVFAYCTNLRCEIPSTLLINAIKVTNLDNFFLRCFYIYGPIPKDLFTNCRNLVSINGMFQDCVGIYNYIVDDDNPYALPPELFQNCYNLTTANSTFAMVGSGLPNSSKLNGALPPNLFQNCTKLTDISNFMYGCGQIKGDLSSDLFRVNTKLANAYYAFANTGIQTLGSQLFFTCTVLKNLSYTFSNCTSLTGPAPEYWSETCPVKATSFAGCYRNDTGLSNYSTTMLAGWK